MRIMKCTPSLASLSVHVSQNLALIDCSPGSKQIERLEREAKVRSRNLDDAQEGLQKLRVELTEARLAASLEIDELNEKYATGQERLRKSQVCACLKWTSVLQETPMQSCLHGNFHRARFKYHEPLSQELACAAMAAWQSRPPVTHACGSG
jgi:hypothetical protein